jgi:hypothetical protein
MQGMSMPQTGTKLESGPNESGPELIRYDDKNTFFIVKSPTGNTLQILDTFADIFFF